jgi:hypothetical protein
MSVEGKQEDVDHLVAGRWKGEKRRRGQIFLGTYYVRGGGDREFGILFASRFKFV